MCEHVTDIAIFCRMVKMGNHGWLTIRPVRVSSSSLSKKLSRTRYPFVLHPCPKPPTKRQSWPQSGQCQFLWLLVVYSSSLSSGFVKDFLSLFILTLSSLHYFLIFSLCKFLIKFKEKANLFEQKIKKKKIYLINLIYLLYNIYIILKASIKIYNHSFEKKYK